MIVKVSMPKIAEDITEAKVQRILVHIEQFLRKEDPFIEVETDKIDIEVPSPVEGRVVTIEVREKEIVKAGQTLISIDSVSSEKDAALQLETLDLSTAIHYLMNLDSAHLCSRAELKNLTFEAFKSFVDEAKAIARVFRGLSLSELDRSLQEELRAAFFFVTDITGMLVGFSPKDLGFKMYREHKHIYDTLRQDSEFSLQILRELISRAGLRIESLQYDPNRAYVFISYSHQDEGAKVAFEIATKLREARVPYFMDQRTGFGEPILKRIQEEITRATHLIVIISPASMRSPWVNYELGFASAREVIIIPYLILSSMQVPSFIGNEQPVTPGGETELIDQLSTHVNPPRVNPKRLVVESFRSSFAKKRIETATKIWHQSMASYHAILDVEQQLENFVSRGGQFWCILSDPRGTALKNSAIRNIKETSSIQHLVTEFERTHKVLTRIARRAKSKDAVILKVIDFVPEPILTLIDPSSPLGVAFVTMSGFKQTPAARPNFLLSQQQEEGWFSFYCISFLELWNHSTAREISLTTRDTIAP